MRNVPGFISASIHKSSDGVRVTNYAQWQGAQVFAAMLKNTQAQTHMKAIAEIATFDAHAYKIVESISVK